MTDDKKIIQIILNTGMSYEDYLKDIHAENYHGTDDNMPDDFERFLENLDVDKLIEYADQFARRARQDEREKIINEIADRLEFCEDFAVGDGTCRSCATCKRNDCITDILTTLLSNKETNV